ncbi:MAG: hypothetical protein ABUS51_02135 [Acidobacteriota bacterium]
MCPNYAIAGERRCQDSQGAGYHEGGMPNSPLPTPLQELGARRFSFYPAIRHVEHNEWQFRRATWSEIVVVNTQSGDEALIPRACVGEVSIIDDPVVIVGLRRELEWRDGAVYPHRRPVIEFPPAMPLDVPLVVNDTGAPVPRPERLAPVVNIRLEPRPARRKTTKIAGIAMLGAIACLIVADVAHEVQTRQRARVTAVDDYSSIVARLGMPATDRTVSSFRLLAYPKRHVTLVLTGRTRYVGTLDASGRVIDSVTLPDGSGSAALLAEASREVLRSLPSF